MPGGMVKVVSKGTGFSRRKSKKAKKIAKKRRLRKSTFRNLPIVNTGLGFPKKIKMTHKYASNITLTNTVGAITRYVFSANGLYDPDITSGGHQPYYFDQMSALYDHYCVIASKITARFLPNAAAGTANPTQVAIVVMDDASQTPSITQAKESSLGVHALVASTAVRPVVLSYKWSAKKYFGSGVLANDELQGTASANPAEQSDFFIVSESSGGTTQVLDVEVLIEYIVIWKELKQVSTS